MSKILSSVLNVFYRGPKTKVYTNRPVLYQNVVQFVTTLPFRIIAYIAIHTFGIRLIYPGTIGILQIILRKYLGLMSKGA